MSLTKKKIRVMVDTETLGLYPGCGVLQIGACTFDLSNTFEVGISYASAASIGCHPGTVNWWNKQPEEIRKRVFGGSYSTVDAIFQFSKWFDSLSLDNKDVEVWSKGADFDIPILDHLYRLYGLDAPWDFRNIRCYRTLEALMPHIKNEEENKLKHTALGDAMYQAQHAELLLQVL